MQDEIERLGLVEDLVNTERCKLTRPQLGKMTLDELERVAESLDRCATMRPAGPHPPLPDIFAIPEEGKGR